MHTRIARAFPIAAVLMLLVAQPALGSSGDVIRDCSEDGVLNKHYSQKELAGALDNLPSDLDEYTDCRTVIRGAQLAGAKSRGGTPRGVISRVDHSAPVNSAEQRSIERAAKGSSNPVDIAGHTISPGGAATTVAATGLGTDIPAFVLVALIALGLAMICGAAFAMQRRWPDRWHTVSTSVGSPIRRLGEGVRRGISRFRR
jgi:hypothetical protein